jgi:hypothetical protein
MEPEERRVAGERSASFAGTKRNARKRNVAGFAGSEEHGSVVGRTRFERGPVRDDGVREHEGRNLPELAADEVLGSLRHVRRVERRRELSDSAVFQLAANAGSELGRREEDLRQR